MMCNIPNATKRFFIMYLTSHERRRIKPQPMPFCINSITSMHIHDEGYDPFIMGESITPHIFIIFFTYYHTIWSHSLDNKVGLRLHLRNMAFLLRSTLWFFNSQTPYSALTYHKYNLTISYLHLILNSCNWQASHVHHVWASMLQFADKCRMLPLFHPSTLWGG